MAEPITTVGVGAIAAYLGKDGLEKLLGPTADYLGLGLRDLAQRRIENIGRIFKKAERKLGERLEKPGAVPPRVLKAVLDDGSFCDDELAVEYYGGVLASSRTELGRDDRGARMSKIIDGLSSYQIRTHFLIYSSIRTLFAKSGLPFNMVGRPKMQMFLPMSAYGVAMDFNAAEQKQFVPILNHIFFGLASENLIESTHWQYGSQESIIKIYPGAKDAGIVCTPSALGAELFLWAFGHASESLEYIFNEKFNPSIENIAPGVPGAAAVKNPAST